MGSWSFYDKTTGQLTGQVFMGPAELLKLNTPASCGAIDGHHDHLSARVDTDTVTVVDYQPPQPSADHEWNAETKRWQLTADALAQIEAAAQAQRDIDAGNLASIPLLRAALLNNDAAALTQLREIHDAVENAAATLKPAADTTTI